ncbi:hypothetical protein ACG7TL_002694 [Trametes sanguinea]
MTVDPASPPTAVDRSDVEYEPLVVESAPTSRDPSIMGYDEQFVKPEGRRGDIPALWAALVSH